MVLAQDVARSVGALPPTDQPLAAVVAVVTAACVAALLLVSVRRRDAD